MRYIQLFFQISFLILFSIYAYAESSCSELVKKLENKKSFVDLNGGMWGYYEKALALREQSANAIQLDSRINKIFLTLYHLCETEKGIPLNDLATYISRNLSKKGENVFKSELLLIGKTPEQINAWFEFYRYAKNHKSRALKISKIRGALDESIPFIESYIKLAERISLGDSSEVILKKTMTLNINIDKLLSQQPYLAQALEEISHVPYWDTNESVGGS